MKANIISTSQIEIIPEDDKDMLLLSFYAEKYTERGLCLCLGELENELTRRLVFSTEWPE